MSWIAARPEAILDGSPTPGKLLDPRTDAALYIAESCVFPKLFLDLVEDVPYFSNPQAIRLAGSVGSPDIDGQSMMTIRGEEQVKVTEESTPTLLSRLRPAKTVTDTDKSKGERVRYGFDVIPSLGKDNETEDEEANDERSGLVEVYVNGTLVKSFKEEARLLGMYYDERLLRISRLVGDKDENTTIQTLGLVGIGNSSGGPVFYPPEKLDDPHASSIRDAAVKSEFIQMIAAGADALEWACD